MRKGEKLVAVRGRTKVNSWMRFKATVINVSLFFYWQRVPPLRVDDLIEDLKDGVRLIALLEVLANTKLVSVSSVF